MSLNHTDMRVNNMSLKHECGDYVFNPNKLEWGPAIVLDIAGTAVPVDAVYKTLGVE